MPKLTPAMWVPRCSRPATASSISLYLTHHPTEFLNRPCSLDKTETFTECFVHYEKLLTFLYLYTDNFQKKDILKDP